MYFSVVIGLETCQFVFVYRTECSSLNPIVHPIESFPNQYPLYYERRELWGQVTQTSSSFVLDNRASKEVRQFVENTLD